LGAALLLGGLLGLERALRGRWAGLRTHMLVSVGSALFALAGIAAATPDAVTRVVQGIATGVGFIGAGTIVKLSDRVEVRGLTTASSVWVAAAVGTVAGLKLYGLAVTGTVLAVVILSAFRRLEELMPSPRGAGAPAAREEP